MQPVCRPVHLARLQPQPARDPAAAAQGAPHLERAGLAPESHDGKALLHILDNFPRDELFQITEDELFDTAIGILNLQERQRIALFVRRDPLERFVSCLVYVPRERYDTRLRAELRGDPRPRRLPARSATIYTHLDDSVLARVQFIIRVTRGAVPAVDMAALERRLAEAGRGWSDRVEEAAARRLRRGAGARPAAPAQAVPGRLSGAHRARPRRSPISTGSRRCSPARRWRPRCIRGRRATAPAAALRLYRQGEPVVLSDVLPILENLGLRIIAEEPFRIDSVDGRAVWIHEFTARRRVRARRRSRPPCARASRRRCSRSWTGAVENDGFNRLVLAAGLSARQATILRLYCKVLRQAGSTFSQSYMEDTLARARGDRAPPRAAVRAALRPGGRGARIARCDRRGAGDRPRARRGREPRRGPHPARLSDARPEDPCAPTITSACRPASRSRRSRSSSPRSEIDLLPLPRPLYEIYVYSPRVEGVHMRAGKVARGGIRWSDRREDFRTEILGLMKAQTVKNAVIVPVGSKGGFVLKRPPPRRDKYRAAFAAEGVECYRILIRGLLDLTDNIVSANGQMGPRRHQVVPPPVGRAP